MKTILNLTPHPITYILDNGETIKFEPTGMVARVATKTVPLTKIDGINFVRQEFGNVEGLPAPENGTFYIVSSIVKAACSYRIDLIVPTDFVRDGKGNIVGCKAFYI